MVYNVAATSGCTRLAAGRRLCCWWQYPNPVVIVADLFGKACLLGVDFTFWIALKTRTLKFSYSSGDILSASEAM